MKRTTTVLAILAMAAIALTAVSADAAVLEGQLGIMDLTENGGINPATSIAWEYGDTYRFIFASSTGIAATSTDIAVYNAFVQAKADASALGLSSVTWKVMASTFTVAARDNTSTNGTVNGTGESFWLLNGTSLVADDYADLFGTDSHSSTINVSETGGAPFDSGDYSSNWTGSTGTGGIKANDELGALDGGTITGLRNFTSGAHWIERFGNSPSTIERGVYGVSEVLTVVPEPATMALVAFGGLALLRRRRNRA